MEIALGVVIGGLIGLLFKKAKDSKELSLCTVAHDSKGYNYEWLEPLGHGKVIKITFEEPRNSGDIIEYTTEWWKVHCKVVNHDPDKLVEDHISYFIGENSPIKLLFYFEDGTIMEPTPEFYELERDWFLEI